MVSTFAFANACQIYVRGLFHVFPINGCEISGAALSLLLSLLLYSHHWILFPKSGIYNQWPQYVFALFSLVLLLLTCICIVLCSLLLWLLPSTCFVSSSDLYLDSIGKVNCRITGLYICLALCSHFCLLCRVLCWLLCLLPSS